MAKVIFILGLSGSGKTHLAKEMIKKSPATIMDEGFNVDFNKNYKKLISVLLKGEDCIVIEIELCYEEDLRKQIKKKLVNDVPEVEIVWKCFENDIEKAKKNILRRKEQGGKEDIEGHIAINERVSPYYTYSPGAEILEIAS